MSFGGSVVAMITTLKNNSRRKNRTHFEFDGVSTRNKSNLKKILDKKATPEQLTELRRKIKKEQLKSLVVLMILLPFVIYLFYLIFGF